MSIMGSMILSEMVMKDIWRMLVLMRLSHPFACLTRNEDVGSTSKSTWDETYSDPILVPVGLVTRA